MKVRSPGRRPSGLTPELVHAADELRVEAEAGAEPEASPVDATEPDSSRAALRDALRSGNGIAREPERARKHARPASWEEAERDVDLDPVQHLVVRAVAAEDVDRFDVACRPRDLGRLARRGREPGLGPRWKRRLHRRQPMLVDAGRERVDDEEPAHCGVA